MTVLNNWRIFLHEHTLEEDELQEKTRASKMGKELPSILEKIEPYVVKESYDVRYFIQFSNINKLGVYPMSNFDTPLGIYSYPLTIEMYDNLKDSRIPFAFERKYIVLFEYAGPRDKVLLWDKYGFGKGEYISVDEEKEKYYFDKLLNNAANVFQKYMPGQIDKRDTNEDNIHNMTRLLALFTKESKCEEPICHLWNVTRRISGNMKEWNYLLRELGINGFIDLGSGLIHPNEPSQAVFFSKQGLSVKEVFDNKLGFSAGKAERTHNLIAKASGLVNAKGQKLIDVIMTNKQFDVDVKKRLLSNIIKLDNSIALEYILKKYSSYFRKVFEEEKDNLLDNSQFVHLYFDPMSETGGNFRIFKLLMNYKIVELTARDYNHIMRSMVRTRFSEDTKQSINYIIQDPEISALINWERAIRESVQMSTTKFLFSQHLTSVQEEKSLMQKMIGTRFELLHDFIIPEFRKEPYSAEEVSFKGYNGQLANLFFWMLKNGLVLNDRQKEFLKITPEVEKRIYDYADGVIK